MLTGLSSANGSLQISASNRHRVRSRMRSTEDWRAGVAYGSGAQKQTAGDAPAVVFPAGAGRLDTRLGGLTCYWLMRPSWCADGRHAARPSTVGRRWHGRRPSRGRRCRPSAGHPASALTRPSLKPSARPSCLASTRPSTFMRVGAAAIRPSCASCASRPSTRSSRRRCDRRPSCASVTAAVGRCMRVVADAVVA